MNKTQQYYYNKISKITLEIEEDYPELYPFLDENPITIPSGPHSDHIEEEELKDFLESLQVILAKHKEQHELIAEQ